MSLGETLVELQELTRLLRRDCPWDREQTALTIVPHTVEEAYEVADAAKAGDPEKLLDELGDLLFQVFFLALLLEEGDQGGLEEVARAVHAKLVRRHPHVFGDATAETPGRVRATWERQKRDLEARSGIFHDLPASLPALLLARKVQRRAAAVDFEYPDLAGALADLDDELAELKAELDGKTDPAPEMPPDPRQAEELGDLLFAAVNVARHLNADPELELRAAATRFRTRVEDAERRAAADGKDWTGLPLEEQDRYFELAKGLE
ncbi:MAG: nucleoside triphosphate pyrophosphohydrolase [Actinomycetota bacterium]|nr:nucleoside triphosphate pyrophosphohydrolase [Actinomycetota bacterium]